jgi:nucleoside-diphosphate-sugar epimerase
MRIAITGSSGFIGSQLAHAFIERGHHVTLMQRRPPENLPNGAQYLPFDLRAPSLPDPAGLTAIVHCAVMFHGPTDMDAEQVNISATLALRDHCRAHDIHFVFLSTMSAHEEAESVYGRHKYRLEQMMTLPNETVLKLGLVIGTSGGLFQRIQKTVARLPVIPLIDGGRQPVQVIPLEDVTEAVLTVTQNSQSGFYLLGSEEVYSLRTCYQLIARNQAKKPCFFSIPFWIPSFVFEGLAYLPVTIPITKENLLGLKHLRSFSTANDLKRLGLTPKTFEQILLGTNHDLG